MLRRIPPRKPREISRCDDRDYGATGVRFRESGEGRILERLRLIKLMERGAAGLSPEGRGLWEELELLAESAPELESRMAREYEVSERIFDLPVSEQGILARLAQLLSGLRKSDVAEARGEPGAVHRVRGVINAARINDRYDDRRVDPGMIPERAIARLEGDV